MEYYDTNITFIPGQTITTNMIMSQLSDAFISQVLISGLIFFSLQVACLWYIKDWDLPAWWKIDRENKEVMRKKLFQTMVMISFVPSMYLPVITIMYKMGFFK